MLAWSQLEDLFSSLEKLIVYVDILVCIKSTAHWNEQEWFHWLVRTSNLVLWSVMFSQLKFSHMRLGVHLLLRVSDSFTEYWIKHLGIYVSVAFKLWEAIFYYLVLFN